MVLPGFSTLQRLLGRAPQDMLKRELPRSVVTHDSIDELALGNLLEDSPRFRSMTVENPPSMPVQEPEAPDFASATPEEVAQWQQEVKRVRAEKEERGHYSSRAWSDLTADTFRSYHTHDAPEVIEEVDPDVMLHTRILPKLMAQDAHAEARNITRDDPTAAAIATMAAVGELKNVLTGELETQLREQQEIIEQREQAEGHQQSLEDLRAEAKARHDAGQPIPKEIVDQIKQAVQERQACASAASAKAEGMTPMGVPAMEAIAQAAEAGASAAEAASHLPSFGSGFGAGEPVYTSPEQALSIAEEWSNNPELRQMAQLFGRLDRDIRFKRSKRVVGGNDEIVDIKFGDNLNRVLPSELALLADEDLEDDFLARYLAQELMEFSTVGEENAGRGPVLMVLDGSGSMHGVRNVWARAVALCLLHIARLEKRDFALVEFSSGGQLEEWMFKANESMEAQKVLDMASHFFGGGTTPIIGVDRAAQLMKEAPKFNKADVVLVGDGAAGFGPEDERLRDSLHAMGVRIFGIGIGGGRFDYIEKYCEPDGYVVDVHDFDLNDPNAATAELATHIT